jgi:hypothetical protein
MALGYDSRQSHRATLSHYKYFPYFESNSSSQGFGNNVYCLFYFVLFFYFIPEVQVLVQVEPPFYHQFL